MMKARRYIGPVTIIEISGIDETTDRAVKVINKQTGKPIWLPRAEINFKPGLVILPEWLARKFAKSSKNPIVGYGPSLDRRSTGK